MDFNMRLNERFVCQTIIEAHVEVNEPRLIYNIAAAADANQTEISNVDFNMGFNERLPNAQ